MLPPVASTVALPPVPVRFMFSDVAQGALAPSVPPPKLNVAAPKP